MLWSKVDFEREIRRQLVELASIRKRVLELPEVLDRLNRLEASHQQLLRKLGELFRAPAEVVPSKTVGAGAAKPKGPSRKAVEFLERYLRTVENTTVRLKAAVEAQGYPVASQARLQDALARPANQQLPSIGTKCASCGKVLFPSVLGGEEVICRAGTWHHKTCVRRGGGDAFSKRGTLN